MVADRPLFERQRKSATMLMRFDRPTWVVHDGKRVAKFQFVGASGHGGYFTIVPFEKGGPQQHTEYLTDRSALAAPLSSPKGCRIALTR